MVWDKKLNFWNSNLERPQKLEKIDDVVVSILMLFESFHVFTLDIGNLENSSHYLNLQLFTRITRFTVISPIPITSNISAITRSTNFLIPKTSYSKKKVNNSYAYNCAWEVKNCGEKEDIAEAREWHLCK